MRGLCLRVFLLVFLFSCTSGGAKKAVEDDFDEFEFEFESNEEEEVEKGNGIHILTLPRPTHNQ